MWTQDFIDLLILQLKSELPGQKAHAELAPYPSRLSEIPGSNVRKAAVCITLFETNGDFVFPLVQRKSNNAKDPHRGQIGLPGGRYESLDDNLWNTALRETEEELGLPQKEVTLLGALTPLFIPVSNNLVFPFIGISTGKPQYSLQKDEIESVLEISLMQLLEKPKTMQAVEASYELKREVPGYLIPPHFIWGATSMILHEFVNILQEIKGRSI